MLNSEPEDKRSVATKMPKDLNDGKQNKFMKPIYNKSGEWHKPTDQEKLDEAHEHFNLPKKKKKVFDWWDKLKISFWEDETQDAEIVEQKKLPPRNEIKIQ